MLGMEQFLGLFGDITILNLAEFILAVVFVVFVFNKGKAYIIDRHEREEELDGKIEEALTMTRQYPEYRRQSLEIQQQLQGEINEIKETQNSITDTLTHMTDVFNKHERNKLRGRIIEYYRYYTGKNNPLKAWTEMEAGAFWDLLEDYEEAQGNTNYCRCA